MKLLIAATIAVFAVFILMAAGITSATPGLTIVMMCASWPMLAAWGWIVGRSGVQIVVARPAPAARPAAAAPKPIQRRTSRIDQIQEIAK